MTRMPTLEDVSIGQVIILRVHLNVKDWTEAWEAVRGGFRCLYDTYSPQPSKTELGHLKMHEDLMTFINLLSTHGELTVTICSLEEFQEKLAEILI